MNEKSDESILQSLTEEQKKEILDKIEPWERSGFQRILGGFWYNYIFNLGFMVYGLVFAGYIFPNFILPYPEALGFKSVVSSLFALLFNIFDVGIGSAVSRFVAEHVGRGNIKRALHYIRFFIWFQMITGLIQITIIAIFSISIARFNPDFGYMTWFFIIYSTIQFPGMLSVYMNALEAFQRFDKKNIVVFMQTVVLELITQIIFIYLGRMFGRSNPMMGELMGATIGYIIGLYIDDFLAMALSAKFFSNILKPYGIKLRETLIPSVPKDVMKDSIIFGLKNLFQGIFYQVSMLFITGVTILWLPSYATIIGLFTIADGITRVVIQSLPTKSAISESYNTGRKHLTDYIIQAQFKWYGILTFYLAIMIIMLIPPLISEISGQYALAATLIPYIMVSRFFIGPIHFSDSVQQGCDKPEYAAYSLMVQMFVRMISFYLFLAPEGLPRFFNNYNYLYAYCLADFPSIIAKNIFAWWLIDKKLIKVNVPVYQTIVAPFISIFPIIFINTIIIQIFNVIKANGIVAIIAFGLLILILMLFIFPIVLLSPILGFLGGWDEKSLDHVKNAALISGPSKWLTYSMYKTAHWAFNHSPLKNLGEKYKIPHELADKEADELTILRYLAKSKDI